jgi:formylglycine-generating enzyme required for sulfatase activity
MDRNNQLDQLFQTAREQKPLQSFDETKDQFLNALNSKDGGSGARKGKFSFTKKWIIMIVSVSIIAGLVLLLTTEPIEKSKKQNVTQVSTKNRASNVKMRPNENKLEKQPIASTITPQAKSYTLDQTFVIEQLDIQAIAEDTASLYPSVDQPQVNATTKYEYVFPKLTEEEIVANHKQKRQMLKALEKFDRKVYTFLVSGNVDVNGKTTSVQAFIIQKTEVTNLEYRTFLFDLLIQGKKEDFLKAKPDQTMWTKLLGQDNKPMEELYFSHGAYNEYPVVNISREGAELYCKWLTQEIQKFVDEKKRSQFNNIRIPTRSEWVKAAQIEGKSNPYPWEGEYLRNSKGCYLANFKPTDSTYFDDGGFFTVKVNSYLPNDFGIFNMSGNAAEMVYDDYPSKNPGTAGGGWMSSTEEIKILGPDPHKGLTEAHPNVGFRVVMTYINRND